MPVAAALLGLAAAAHADDAAPSAEVAGVAPSPYSLGVSAGLTHDSNVYSVPGGPGDSYLTTSLLGSFDQKLGRQRVFGKADVGVHRYRDQTQLDNTSYDLTAGLDWETVHDLSGSVHIGANQQLSAPGATIGVPDPVRNQLQTENVNAVARWGGPSLYTLEATLGYNKIDNSAEQFVTSDFTQRSASLAGYYRPRTALRVGLAGRFVETDAPQAFIDPSSGGFLPNTVKSDNLDFLLDYDVTGLVTANARLSYTHQTSTGFTDTRDSGFTGDLGVTWRATGKTTLSFDIAHNAGFDATQAGTTTAPPGSALSTGQYQNTRVSDSANLRVTYSATAKIQAFAAASYLRSLIASPLIDPSTGLPAPDTHDTVTGLHIGANYAVARNWSLACNLGHENRHVTGGLSSYSYNDTNVGCLAQYNLHL